MDTAVEGDGEALADCLTTVYKSIMVRFRYIQLFLVSSTSTGYDIRYHIMLSSIYIPNHIQARSARSGTGSAHLNTSHRLDKVTEVSRARVDTGVSSARTAIAPGGDTNKDTVGDEGTTGVTLAAVLATLLLTSAQHARGDLVEALVVLGTGLLVDNRDLDGLQGGRDVAALLEGAPAGDGADGAGGGERGVLGGELDGLDAGAVLEVLVEGEDGNVVVDGLGVVVGVDGDGGDAHGGAAGGGRGGAGADTEVAGGLALGAVAGGDDVLVVDDAATADERAALQQADLVGELLDGGLGAADDVLLGEDAGEDGEEGEGGLHGDGDGWGNVIEEVTEESED